MTVHPQDAPRRKPTRGPVVDAQPIVTRFPGPARTIEVGGVLLREVP